MAIMTKRRKAIEKSLIPGKIYPFAEAVQLLQGFPGAKFKESVDLSINLGIDTKKSDQVVRGAIVLPHGTGKTVRVAVFAQGEKAESAKAAGADTVGMEELAKDMQAGNLNYDVVIASPDAMGVVGRLGQVLGPRGLMPNPKVGTVTQDVAQAVRHAKGGQVRYRADKTGIVNCSIGKINFEAGSLKENAEALIESLRKARPSTAKGIYIKKISVSTTMGPGLVIDLASLTTI